MTGDMTEHRTYEMADGRQIAHRYVAGDGPLLVFLPGYMSDMAGSKALAVYDWAQSQGRACLLLDYSGCGESSGDFADGTLTRWRDEVAALIDHYAPSKAILIGSSMGGWLMLLIALAQPQRIAGLVGIAPAPDFTEWGTSAEDKASLRAGKVVLEDNPYGPEPTPTHPGFWSDGQAQLLLNAKIALDCPVRILQGQADPDVPWEIALRLAAALRSDDVQVTLIKDGDHRLSRDQDIALLIRTVAELSSAV